MGGTRRNELAGLPHTPFSALFLSAVCQEHTNGSRLACLPACVPACVRACLRASTVGVWGSSCKRTCVCNRLATVCRRACTNTYVFFQSQMIGRLTLTAVVRPAVGWIRLDWVRKINKYTKHITQSQELGHSILRLTTSTLSAVQQHSTFGCFDLLSFEGWGAIKYQPILMTPTGSLACFRNDEFCGFIDLAA